MRGPIGSAIHVLLEPFVVANTCVIAATDHVDETVLGGDLDPDVGIGLQEGMMIGASTVRATLAGTLRRVCPPGDRGSCSPRRARARPLPSAGGGARRAVAPRRSG